jgi:hypothetical protein
VVLLEAVGLQDVARVPNQAEALTDREPVSTPGVVFRLSHRQGILVLLPCGHMLAGVQQVVDFPLGLVFCRSNGLQELVEQCCHCSNVLACTKEPWGTIVVLQNLSVRVTSHGARVSTIALVGHKPLVEPRLLFLQLTLGLLDLLPALVELPQPRLVKPWGSRRNCARRYSLQGFPPSRPCLRRGLQGCWA